MPTFEHEGLIELFRDGNLLAVELAEARGIKLPAWDAVVSEPTEVPERLNSRNADAVFRLTDGDRSVFAFVIEIQRQPDDDKVWSWPAYLLEVRDRWRCPVVVLVICTDNATARWGAQPIELGPGSVITPCVVGPGQVPVVTDPEQARRSPQLAVLSALAHGGAPDRREVLDALVVAYNTAGHARGSLYHDLMTVGLPVAALKYLEARMAVAGTYEYKSEFARTYFSRGKAEGEAKGKAEGEANALLRVLARRGIEVPAGARDRITSCLELEQLETWLDRAVTATSIHDVLRD